MLPTLLFLFSVTIVYGSSSDTDPRLRVRISSGEIEGKVIWTENGLGGYGFMGIPYAQPPLRLLRFRNPVKPIPWNGVLECKKYRNNCWQVHTTLAGEKFTGVEDCLYLNVFSGLNCTDNTKCPVLYYIHGGQWEFDTPSVFPPELLVENFASHGLVVVTIAYRLGVFGFWSSGGEEALGNYALHDMIYGLQWVQREITHFGGDPGKVTIMGHSSGGVTVSLLTLSPKAQGLFHQAVMMSGNGVEDAVLSTEVSLFRKVATAVGCTNESKYLWRDWTDDWRRRVVVDCMRRIDMDVLGNTYLKLKGPTERTGPRYDGPDGLFPQPVSKMVQNRQPYTALTGTTKREFGNALPSFENATADTVSALCQTVIGVIGLEKHKDIVQECHRLYVSPYVNSSGNGTFNIWAQQSERIMSTLAFYSQCYKDAATLRRKGARVYLYSFDYEKTGQEGITPYHAFDLTFLIGVHPFQYDERDKQIQRVYAPLFANFVKYGDPTPPVESQSEGYETWTVLEWPLGFNYYSIDLPTPKVRLDYHKEDILFWNYVVPLTDIEIRPGRPAQRGLNNMKINSGAFQPLNYGGPTETLTDWHAAFVVALTVLAVTVFATMTFLARFILTRTLRKRSAQEPEAVELISDNKTEVSYRTFETDL